MPAKIGQLDVLQAIKAKPGITGVQLEKLFGQQISWACTALYETGRVRREQRKSDDSGRTTFAYFWLRDDCAPKKRKGRRNGKGDPAEVLLTIEVADRESLTVTVAQAKGVYEKLKAIFN